ncbi:MAG: isoprenylcysteine carboxylmethyltransferase family protein [Acidobacteriota bacterium]
MAGENLELLSGQAAVQRSASWDACGGIDAMSIVYNALLPAMWAVFVVYWWAAAGNVKSNDRHEPAFSRILRLVCIVAAIVLLAWPRLPFFDLDLQLLPSSPVWFWTGAVVTAAGLLFAVWARHMLGGNWSQAVTVKEDHQLVTNGPYALVRHPIYTGFLFGFLGCALARGELRGFAAVILVFAVLFQKLRLEEKWLGGEFGDDYAAYRRRVRALLPFLL